MTDKEPDEDSLFHGMLVAAALIFFLASLGAIVLKLVGG